MADSSSFSSLLALVDNHLSRTNLQQDGEQPSTSGMGSFRLPPLNIPRGQSDTRLSSIPGFGPSTLRFPIPSTSMSQNPVNSELCNRFSRLLSPNQPKEEDEDSLDGPPTPMSMSDCPINDVLAIQLSNMFKAREAKEEEKRKQEQLKLEENLQKMKLEESSCLIDLMPAVQQPGQVQPKLEAQSSNSSSMESLCLQDAFEDIKTESEGNEGQLSGRPVSPLKTLKQDMSYIMKHKLGKCSQFGKVLCARYRPVAAPYIREPTVIPPEIKVFDFSTQSPDDIVMERMRKPSFYTQANRPLTVYE